jgi:acetyltransferase-like isoleucine patch superfamily enzyme
VKEQSAAGQKAVSPVRVIRSKIEKHGGNPSYVAAVLAALARGAWYALFFRLFRRNVRIQLPFKAFAPVSITGTGAVRIGRNCTAGLSVFKGLTIHTLTDRATVSIGEDCNLEGLTIRCSHRVEIGSGTITALSLIQDCRFIAGGNNGGPEEVVIGSHAWLGGNSVVLGGSHIGNHAVVGAGALCADVEIADYSLATGSPVRRGLPIENILKFKEAS